MRKTHICVLVFGLLLVAPVGCLARTGGTENNKAVARQLFEVALNQDNWNVYNEIHTPDFVAHAGKKSEDLAGDLRSAKGWRQAFPDGRYTVNQIIAEGDYVVVYFTGRGTNTGAGNGLPATGKSIELTGTTIFRFTGGKIAEEWTEYDRMTLMKQLGLMPSSPQ
ncbi:MAG: ester cyclase [Terriglobales bacterium]